jgi:hypothetical protein
MSCRPWTTRWGAPMYSRSEHLRTSSGVLRIRYERPRWAYGSRWYWVHLGAHSIGTVEKMRKSRGWSITKDHAGLPRAGEFRTRRDAVLSLLKAAGYND